MWTSLRRGVALAAALTLAAPRGADANGRFPQAQQVVIGPGPRSDVVALRVTFGILLSTDGGRTFRWLCEEGLYFPFVPAVDYDPGVEVDSRGEVVFSYENGVRHTPDGCASLDVSGTARRTFMDITSVPSGETIFGIESTEGMTAGIWRIDAATHTAGRFDTGLRDVRYFDTIEVAPSDPRRLYVTGRAGADFHAVFYRSDDGGMTLTRMTPTTGPADSYWVSGVDPRDPDTLYMRAPQGLGTELRRSRDGGRTFQPIAQTQDPMLGFAISDDGRTLWVGSIEAGLLRSDDGGESFWQVHRLPVFCLRQHAGVLWACSDWETQPFALGRSRDQGATFEPVLQFTNYSQLRGAPTCAMPSEGTAICEERWPLQQRMLNNPLPPVTPPDAGRADVPRDVTPARDGGADAGFDAGLMDASVARDAGPMTPPDDSCHCGVPGAPSSSRGLLTLLATAALTLAARRSRRGPTR